MVEVLEKNELFEDQVELENLAAEVAESYVASGMPTTDKELLFKIQWAVGQLADELHGLDADRDEKAIFEAMIDLHAFLYLFERQHVPSDDQL